MAPRTAAWLNASMHRTARTSSRLVLVLLAACGAAATEGVEAIALDGRELTRPPMPAGVRAQREADLAAAEAVLLANPSDPDALIWVGRRLGYLGRFHAAIATFTRGAEQHPRDARMLRHRGHRHITVRQFDRAVRDLELAAQLMLAGPDAIEPDGQPNARNVPTGTLYFNVYYHLALARYLARDFDGAAATWALCQTVSQSPDKLVATSYWHYLTLRWLGRDEEARALLAPVRADLDVIENHAYHRLLLAFAAETVSEDVLRDARDNDLATLGNGVATWLGLSGAHEAARALWHRVVATTPWPAFGHIAAEVALAGK